MNCVLPPFVADKLGLARPFRQMAEYTDGRREEVDVTEPVLIEIEGRKVYEECLVLGDEMLIGQTALEKTDLHVDCRSRRLLPNPAHPHQPIVKVK
jgi:predicted aspartyl protease